MRLLLQAVDGGISHREDRGMGVISLSTTHSAMQSISEEQSTSEDSMAG